MSISEQIENLRRIAKEWNPDTPVNPVSVTLNQAADTIESLSAKLKAANEELERWHTDHINEKIKNPFAYTSTLICHNCDHKDEYIEELEAEVEELKAANMERIGNNILKEIKEKAQELSNQHWGDDERHLIGKGIQCMCVQAENIIKANMERSAEDCSGWIPCKDRLPNVEVSENVKTGICSDNGERFLITDTEGYVYESTFWLSTQEFEDKAIAWMPLPEPYHEPYKSIAHGKEHRKPYRGAKAIDRTCRNHGSCEWCRGNRTHKNDKKGTAAGAGVGRI